MYREVTMVEVSEVLCLWRAHPCPDVRRWPRTALSMANQERADGGTGAIRCSTVAQMRGIVGW